MQDPTTVHRATECVARLAFLRWLNRAPERPTVTVRQVEVWDREEKQEESDIIQMLRGISQQLQNLAWGKFAAGESQHGPGTGGGPFRYQRAHLWGAVLGAGEEDIHSNTLWGVVLGVGEDTCSSTVGTHPCIGLTAWRGEDLPMDHMVRIGGHHLGWVQRPLQAVQETRTC